MTHKFRDVVVTYNINEIGSNEKFTMHTHTTAELFCFISGEAVYHVEGSTYELKSGDILLMRPSEAHYIEVNSSIEYERMHLNFNTDIFSSIDIENTLMSPYFEREAGKRNLYRAEDFKDKTYFSYLQNILCAESRLTVLAYLLLLLQELGVVFRQEIRTVPDTTEYKIIKYVNNNLEKNLSLQELSERFFISRSQLCRLFRKSTGTTIGKYVTVKRLITAKQQIEEGKKPTAVYLSCGYKEYSSFYRAYRKYFGHSPCIDQGKRNAIDFEEDRMEIL